MNPGGSVKDRICLAMIEAAEREGRLRPATWWSSPPAAIPASALRWCARVKGYRCVLTMPESMSLERRQLLQAFGAEVVLTAEEEQMEGAIAKAREIAAATPNSFVPSQFDNPANPEVHRETTAREILHAMEGSPIDAFVVGRGHGRHHQRRRRGDRTRAPCDAGHRRRARRLRRPLSRGERGPTKIQGLAAGFVPKNYDRSVVDEVPHGERSRRLRQQSRARPPRGIVGGNQLRAPPCTSRWRWHGSSAPVRTW